MPSAVVVDVVVVVVVGCGGVVTSRALFDHVFYSNVVTGFILFC